MFKRIGRIIAALTIAFGMMACGSSTPLGPRYSDGSGWDPDDGLSLGAPEFGPINACDFGQLPWCP